MTRTPNGLTSPEEVNHVKPPAVKMQSQATLFLRLLLGKDSQFAPTSVLVATPVGTLRATTTTEVAALLQVMRHQGPGELWFERDPTKYPLAKPARSMLRNCLPIDSHWTPRPRTMLLEGQLRGRRVLLGGSKCEASKYSYPEIPGDQCINIVEYIRRWDELSRKRSPPSGEGGKLGKTEENTPTVGLPQGDNRGHKKAGNKGATPLSASDHSGRRSIGVAVPSTDSPSSSLVCSVCELKGTSPSKLNKRPAQLALLRKEEASPPVELKVTTDRQSNKDSAFHLAPSETGTPLTGPLSSLPSAENSRESTSCSPIPRPNVVCESEVIVEVEPEDLRIIPERARTPEPGARGSEQRTEGASPVPPSPSVSQDEEDVYLSLPPTPGKDLDFLFDELQ